MRKYFKIAAIVFVSILMASCAKHGFPRISVNSYRDQAVIDFEKKLLEEKKEKQFVGLGRLLVSSGGFSAAYDFASKIALNDTLTIEIIESLTGDGARIEIAKEVVKSRYKFRDSEVKKALRYIFGANVDLYPLAYLLKGEAPLSEGALNAVRGEAGWYWLKILNSKIKFKNTLPAEYIAYSKNGEEVFRILLSGYKNKIPLNIVVNNLEHNLRLELDYQNVQAE